MEPGTPPADRPSDQPGGEPSAPSPGPEHPRGGPESPAPPRQGPQSPASAAQPAPPPPTPQSPASQPQYPPPPQAAPRYTGPQPPGGWQAPPAAAPSPWAGAPLAGWGSRVGATLLDWLILAIAVIPLVLIVIAVAAGSETGAIVTGVISALAYLVALLFYGPVLMAREGRRNGQTWGKQIVGIRVVRDNGQPFELGAGFVREFVVKGLLFGTVGGFFLSIPMILDWLWPLWDDQNRCLHDMVVSTHVMQA